VLKKPKLKRVVPWLGRHPVLNAARRIHDFVLGVGALRASPNPKADFQ
jgi:hypothetical protein